MKGHTTPLAAHRPLPVERVVWACYAGNAQHTAVSMFAPSGYTNIAWSTALDANPPVNGNDLSIHYGSAALTGITIVIPYKLQSGHFEFDGRLISTGHLNWSYTSTYNLPPGGWNWIPPVSGTLLPNGSYVGPVYGGGIFVRPHVDSATQTPSVYYPCGNTEFNNYSSQYAQNVFISTPITADISGNVYYGVRTYGAVHNGMTSGFVKMDTSGNATMYTCAANHWPALNAAPAVSNDGKTIYAVEAVNGSIESHMIALNASTMAKTADALLIDPSSGYDAYAEPDGTSCPLVGPDGDV